MLGGIGGTRTAGTGDRAGSFDGALTERSGGRGQIMGVAGSMSRAMETQADGKGGGRAAGLAGIIGRAQGRGGHCSAGNFSGAWVGIWGAMSCSKDARDSGIKGLATGGDLGGIGSSAGEATAGTGGSSWDIAAEAELRALGSGGRAGPWHGTAGSGNRAEDNGQMTGASGSINRAKDGRPGGIGESSRHGACVGNRLAASSREWAWAAAMGHRAWLASDSAVVAGMGHWAPIREA